ncbi:ATP dependent DNA ligase domain-containing protein [Pilobolus umbonatus]|nr:ATP dependent DNA ligase domain-containing protein [Pilobolus umbonatus]
MRLFLPKLDEREYGLKEDTIAQLSGDFPNVAFEKIKVRSIVNRNTQTVQQTNELLDELANDRNMDNQIKLFRRILNNYTSYEIKWLLRIIIKDLKMGMTENSIFNVFHPYAKSAFDGGKSLKEICYEFSNTSQATHTEIQLFAPCLPQRGFRGTTIEIRRFIADVPKPFYVEQKVDGVRFLLHCDKEKDKFMWFTRNRNNETEKYGASSADMSKLSGHVSNGILAESVILDGEMVAYDPSSDILLPFGTLNTSSRNDITDDSQPHPCFIVFDILWFSGKPLIHHSLQNRLLLLDKYIKNQGNYMRLLPRKPMNTEEEVYTELNYIIEKRMEGLILKNPLSPYRLASKDRAWIKLKPDYMDSLIDTSDLLVVGAKYGEGRRGSKLARLLCAVRDDRVESDEPRYLLSISSLSTIIHIYI